MHKEKRLDLFKERIKGKQGVSKAIEAYKLVNDVLSEVEAEFAEHSEEKMTIPALTSEYVQEYGRKGIMVPLIKHIILINYNGAFRIERIHEGTEFISKANANGELFEAVENFKIVQPQKLKDSREKQGFKMHERLNQIWLNLVADDTTLSTPEEAITFLKSHFAKVEDSLPEDIRDNPSYRMMVPALTTEGVWKENGNNRYWEAFKERKVVIYDNGSIIIWEKDQVWFEKGDVPPLIKTNIDTPNINSVETAQRPFKGENESHHVQVNRYKQYFFG